MNFNPRPSSKFLAFIAAGIAALMAACSSPPPAPKVEAPPAPTAPPVAVKPAEPAPPANASHAATPLAYRRDAAHHLYGQNAHRIYKGKMPPLLYAIGVLQVEVNDQGRVTSTHWMRSPSQAPEVVAEIERTVHMAEPFPAPVRMGRVTYTDTWLWHKSGYFQLDTLTEGQL